MDTTWIVVADNAGARLFAHEGPGTGLKPINELSHPAGRLHDRDIGSDRPGRSFDRMGSGRHAMDPRQTPREHENELFTRDIAKVLTEGRHQHRYQKLVLVAAPKVLGSLRAQLDDATSEAVMASLDKDLTDVSASELPRHLAPLLAL